MLNEHKHFMNYTTDILMYSEMTRWHLTYNMSLIFFCQNSYSAYKFKEFSILFIVSRIRKKIKFAEKMSKIVPLCNLSLEY